MESAVRYDFSFPPKSTNLNNNMSQQRAQPKQQAHQQQQQQYQSNDPNYVSSLSLCKSASMSNMLPSNCTHVKSNRCPSCTQNNNCHFHSNLNLSKGQQQPMKQHQVCAPNVMHHQTKVAHHSVHSGSMPHQQHHTVSSHGNGHGTQQTTHSVAPLTPKDSNCSFTFDDFKNTLSFMDDSPLIPHNAKNSIGMRPVDQPLTVLTSISTGDIKSLSSRSSTSSNSSTSSQSSNLCHSSVAPGFLPKSNSNPMCLSTSSCSTASTSPVSTHQTHSSIQSQMYQQHNLTHNTFNSSNQLPYLHHQVNTNATNSVMDILCLKNKTSPTSATHDLINNSNLLTSVPPPVLASSSNVINSAIETAAKKYRCAAQVSEATCCWKGKLPPKQYKAPILYSTKVFVGGLPWDITEEDIIKEFGVFGPCRVEWTNKEKYTTNTNAQHGSGNGQQSFGNQSNGRLSMSNLGSNGAGRQQSDNFNAQSKHRLSPGFAYVIYDNEYSVRTLVGNCIEDYANGRDRVEFYFKISTRRVRNKEVQIIPWILADNNFALCTPKELDPKKTVFVGNLHGTMTARDLAHIMNELFGCVVYAGIDIDKLKYPIGSGRVTFSHQHNFMRAVRAAFVDIQSSKFCKRIQIDPYLEDVQCCTCQQDKGIYFCRDFQCFNYYCGGCWEKQHSFNQLGNHKPLMRKREDKQQF